MFFLQIFLLFTPNKNKFSKKFGKFYNNYEKITVVWIFLRTAAVPIACSSTTATTATVAESRDASRRSSVVASEVSEDTVGSMAECSNKTGPVDDDDDEEEIDDVTPALHRWRSGVAKAATAAQLTMCLDALDCHIAWERSVMKASCQICRRGDDDSHLLLCDGCDLGYHTYCFKVRKNFVFVWSFPDYLMFCHRNFVKKTRLLDVLWQQTLLKPVYLMFPYRNFVKTRLFDVFFSQRWKISQMEIGTAQNAFQK